ncbi:hypothetical protein N0V85_001886 [Neurospora sp. IMI 360204]|nr:hypothetical protein N0V85_001886 [Neurospora sp. IMI 360204]
MASRHWPKELNKLCPDCEHLFPPSGQWPWDGNRIGKFVDIKGDVRELSVEELDASATSNGCHLCRSLLECVLPGSMKFNRHDYPTWFELNKEFRYSVSLYDARHDSNQHLRSVSLGLTATGERRWMGVQRTVQFGPQLYWECREQFASESVPSSKAFYDIKHPDLITTFDKGKESAGGTFSPAEIWDTVVKIYTTTQLTQQSDKLVALRGVFNRFWERFEAEAEARQQQESSQQGQHQHNNIDWCIAGLWKRDLIRQLLWRRETYHVDSIPNPERWPSGEDAQQKLFNARATEVLKLYPSWSWAACPSYLGFGICFTTQPTDRLVEDMVVIEKIEPLLNHHNHNQKGTCTYTADYTAFDSSALILRGLLYDGINAIDLSQVFFDWHTKSESSGTVKHHAKLIRRSAWWIYFDRPLRVTPYLRPKNVGVLMVRLVGLGEARQTRWMHGLLVEKLGTGTVTVGEEDDGLPLPTYRRMGFFLLRSKRGLIPGVEWPERFGTKEEAEEAVREVRERRGRFPLLRLV